VHDTIGFIGIGNMGAPISMRLQDAGFALVVYDARAEALAPIEAHGAKRASSPAEVASQAETVVLSLPTPEIAEAVALGPGGVSSGNAVKRVVDLSTTGPRMAHAIGQALARKAVMLIDAPVSGGVAGARAGTLAVMVACARADYDALEPMLKIIGRPFHVGTRPGLGQTMKLVNNLLSGAALAVTSEAVVMGVKAGLEPDIMIDVLNAASGRNSATQDKFPRSILPRRFDAGFSTGLMYKDLKLFMEEAETMGLALETAKAVCALWAKTLAEIGPDSDFTRIAQCVERAAKVEVRGKASKDSARG